MHKYKVAIATIARNEALNVDGFLTSCMGADEVVIGLDVRTTDNTREKLVAWGVTIVDIDLPKWDFGAARNLVLDQVSKDVDIVVSIDLDERITPSNWRQLLDEQWEDDLDIGNYHYVYHWADEAQTVEGLVILGYKFNNRHTLIWQNQIHENLKYIGPNKEEKKRYINGISVLHYPDLTKKRDYADIIRDALVQDPTNDWMLYVLCRDDFTSKRYAECIENCKKYLSQTEAYKTVELGECRGEVCLKIARCLHFISQETGKPVDERGSIQLWCTRAIAEAPNVREHWVYGAEAWEMFPDPVMALACYRNALSITDKSLSPELESRCWNDGYLINQIKNLKLKLNLKNKHI